MLHKISNIELSSDFNKSKKSTSKRRKSSGSLLHEVYVSDNLSISPAFRLLGKYNFVLQDYKNEKEFYRVSFGYKEFSFVVEIHLISSNAYDDIIYTIVKEGKESKTLIKIITKTELKKLNAEKPAIKNLEYLFKRIESLNIDSELNFHNTKALSNLLDGIYSEIMEEFRDINSIIISFLEKFIDKKITSIVNKEFENELIIIEKLQPIND